MRITRRSQRLLCQLTSLQRGGARGADDGTPSLCISSVQAKDARFTFPTLLPNGLSLSVLTRRKRRRGNGSWRFSAYGNASPAVTSTLLTIESVRGTIKRKRTARGGAHMRRPQKQGAVHTSAVLFDRSTTMPGTTRSWAEVLGGTVQAPRPVGKGRRCAPYASLYDSLAFPFSGCNAASQDEVISSLRRR